MLIPKGGLHTYNQMVDRVRNKPVQGGQAVNASYSLGNYYPQIDDEDDEFNQGFDQYAAGPRLVVFLSCIIVHNLFQEEAKFESNRSFSQVDNSKSENIKNSYFGLILFQS